MVRLVIFGGEALNLQALRPWLERPWRPASAVGQHVRDHGNNSPRHLLSLSCADWSVRHAARSGGRLRISAFMSWILSETCRRSACRARYVGGAGASAGYLNRPELTADRFVPHPFCGRLCWLYRTGTSFVGGPTAAWSIWDVTTNK